LATIHGQNVAVGDARLLGIQENRWWTRIVNRSSKLSGLSSILIRRQAAIVERQMAS
jgi:hypothetical protein